MTTSKTNTSRRLSALALAFAAAMLTTALAGAEVPASALAAGPQWTVASVSRPTNFAPGDQSGEDSYVLTITNTGDRPSDGSPITITDELPEGVSLDPAGAIGENQLWHVELNGGGAEQEVTPGEHFTCAANACTYNAVVIPDQTLLVKFPVDVVASPPASCEVPPGAVSCLTNVVRVAGGGAPDASRQTPTAISSQPAKFGASPGGETTALSSTQAGAHPDLTNSLAFNTVNAAGSLAGDPKTVEYDLPPGFAGADLVDTPSCSPGQFLQRECPIGSQVGVTTVTYIGVRELQKFAEVLPVFNLTPDPGAAAKLGFVINGNVLIEGDIFLRADSGPKAIFENIQQGKAELDNVSLTLWGVPAAPIHDALRKKFGTDSTGATFGASSDTVPRPFFTNPTSCSGEQSRAVFTVSGWKGEGPVAEEAPFGPIVGCDRLTIEPSLTGEVTTPFASSATGLNVVTTLPQTYENPSGLATSHLRKAVVTLPEGMTVNPSAGSGLGACTPQQLDAEAAQEVPGRGCPNNSKLGTIRAKTPALAEEAEGSVFLAEPYNNPFHSLLALYIVARIPNRGIIVKAAGQVVPNELTGQLVTTFDTSVDSSGSLVAHDGLPPVPIGTLTFKFRQGATSPLVTPPACGSYEIKAAIVGWSDPEGAPLTPLIPPFSITNGFDGGGCPSGGQAPFSPQVTAGTENPNAGSYSPLDIHITRNDGEQEITRFSSVLPAGLTANLSGLPFCSDAAIAFSKSRSGAAEEAQPSCPPATQIGTTVVGAGVGSVLAQASGKLYMAGPYNGAPFSVVAITSAKVGPFDLGTVVVREALSIDPETAAVTVDAKASDPIPHIIKGIVVHVRDIRVSVNRQSFTLNPTNCNPFVLSATVNGAGADATNPADDVPATIADPFRVTACQALSFKPHFEVSTPGKTSKRDGAGLHVKLTYPNAPQGSQANIKYVKVDLPLQLPSRLSTLQKACLNRVFEANPASCPPLSIVGHATAVTPILPVPLSGPAYFVSHGGEKFPELVMVLQGYGVRILLRGETFISKAGITSSTFNAVPDQPVSSFELTLPQGPGSALAANGNLCALTRTVSRRKAVTVRIHGHSRRVTRTVKQTVAVSLHMPTAFVGQNGAVIHQSTPIAVTGCAKAKKAIAKTRRHRHGAKKKR
jgi:hypothetical protein